MSKRLFSMVLAVTMLFSGLVIAPYSASAAKSGAILPSDDTFIQSASPDATAGGEGTMLAAYNGENPCPIAVPYSGGSSRGAMMSTRDILMRFDLGDISPDTVKSAVIELTVSSVSNIGTSDSNVTNTSFVAFEANGSWSENTATWNNAPAVGGVVGISSPLTTDNDDEGAVISVDVTAYLRENNASTLSLRIKSAAAGAYFYTKEASDASKRPRLVVEYDESLKDSGYFAYEISDDTFTRSAEPNTPGQSVNPLIIASTQGSGAAGSSRNAYVQFYVPVPSDSYKYASARLLMYLQSSDNADQTVTLHELKDSTCNFGQVTWTNAPAFYDEAASSATVEKSVKSLYKPVVFDITDYINAHPTDSGFYSFMLSGDTAITKYFSIEENTYTLYRPRVEFIYKETAQITVEYVDSVTLEVVATDSYSEIIDSVFALDEIATEVNAGGKKYYYNESYTLSYNELSLKVSSDAGENVIKLFYDDKSIVSFDQINVSTTQNVAPVLPESVTVHFSDNTAQSAAVVWEGIPASKYAASGEFTVMGHISEMSDYEVYATVTVFGIIEIPDDLYVTTAPGAAPILPRTIGVLFDDGERRDLGVTWSAVNALDYAEVGKFDVSGRLDLSGSAVSIAVWVEKGDLNRIAAAADTFTAENASAMNYNSDEESGERVLRVSGTSGGGAAMTNRKSFLRFDISRYESKTPNDVVNARLSLYFNSIANSANPTYKVYGILPENDAWGEETLTWNAQQSVIDGAVLVDTITIDQGNFSSSRVDFDVTGFVRNYLDAGSISFYIEADTCAAILSSREGRNAPELVISDYIPDANITVRTVAVIEGIETEIANREYYIGKQGKTYEYDGDVPVFIVYDGVCYYIMEDASRLSTTSLEEDNLFTKHYEFLRTVSVNDTLVRTYEEKPPVLGQSVTVVLEDGRSVIKGVAWDEIPEENYAKRGSFEVFADVADTSIRAKATVEVYKRYYDDEITAVEGAMYPLDANTEYELVFTKTADEEEAVISSSGEAIRTLDVLSGPYKTDIGEETHFYFTAPDAEALEMSAPMQSARLYEVDGKRADLRVDYVDEEGKLLSQKEIFIPYGSVYALTDDDVNGEGWFDVLYFDAERSVIENTATPVTANALDMAVTFVAKPSDRVWAELLCCEEKTVSASKIFTAKARVYNGSGSGAKLKFITAVYDEDGTLSEVKVEDINAPAGSGFSEYEISLEMTADARGAAFIWSGDNALVPLTLRGEKYEAASPEWLEEMKPDADVVADIIRLANDYYQSQNSATSQNSFWGAASYNIGNIAAYALLGDEEYLDYSMAWADANTWAGNTNADDPATWTYTYNESSTSSAVLFGDWQACFGAYLDLYAIEPTGNKLIRTLEVMNYQITTGVDEYWWWADAIFMVMPTMARLYNVTDNPLYLEKMHDYFEYAKELMYDEEEHLFYRDENYSATKNLTPNGKKNFWARGNGWVIAGLARTLDKLDDSCPYKDEYLEVYRAMAYALRDCQQFDAESNGFWSQSLLDGEYAPGYETSGTAFFTYAIMWGINAGLLREEEYAPSALSAWNYLSDIALQHSGAVGYVQPIGSAAGSSASASDSSDFGLAAFLMAACEVARYAGYESDNLGAVDLKNFASVAMKTNSPYFYHDGAVYSDNLVSGGDFEGSPYIIFGADNFKNNTLYVNGRTRGMRVTDSHGGNYAYAMFDENSLAYIAEVKRNVNYTFSAWVKLPLGDFNFDDSARDIYLGDELVYTYEIGRGIEKTGDWQNITFDFTPASDTAIFFAFAYDGEAGNLDDLLLVDDIELYASDARAEPRVFDGEVWVPLLETGAHFGYDTYTAVQNRKTRYIVTDNVSHSISVCEDGEYSINSMKYYMSEAPKIIGGRLYIPLSMLAHAFDKEIYHDGDLIIAGGRKTPLYACDEKIAGHLSNILTTGFKDVEAFDEEPPEDDLILVPNITRYISATDQQSGNEAVKVSDGRYSTRWSAQASNDAPQALTMYLGGEYSINKLGVGVYGGETRKLMFAFETSRDGKTWTTVLPDDTETDGVSVEYFTFDAINAKYVRFSSYGCTDTASGEWNYWVSVTELKVYGTLIEGSRDIITENSFTDVGGYTVGKEPSMYLTGWQAHVLDEETYTSYTPALGSELYADYAAIPASAGLGQDNVALHLYDNVTRVAAGSGTGLGAIGAYKTFSSASDDYMISFTWYVPNYVAGRAYNASWAGFTLSDGVISGGADTTNPAAIQIRLNPSGMNKMRFNVIRSIQYNEGTQSGLLGYDEALDANVPWKVMINVRASTNLVTVTISDGTRSASDTVFYNFRDYERIRTQTWYNSAINTIMFNTGAGGYCEMYVDDFEIYDLASESGGETSEVTLYSQGFDGYEDASGVIYESGDLGSGYTPSLGSALYAEVTNMPAAAGLGAYNPALHLYDNVGRETNPALGAGAVISYVDIPYTDNTYRISFDMYAPDAGQYGGFSLGHGHNTGGNDRTHPMALQVRFSPQSSGMQFNYYPSIHFNKGSWGALVATGSNRMTMGRVWHFDLTVNPEIQTIKIEVSDGSRTSSKTITYQTSGEDNISENWSANRIDTIMFNSGAGTSADMYIDNLTVIDTGTSTASYAATGGTIRLEATNGNGRYMYGYSTGSQYVGENINPYYTRYIERRGLADPDCVSIESLSRPGYFLVASGGSVWLGQFEDNDWFKRAATFCKVPAIGVTDDTAKSYRLYNDSSRYLRDNSGTITAHNPGNSSERKQCSFYLRDESVNYVSDGFKGNSISGQWYVGYPWYTNYHNHSGVVRKANVVVSGGNVLLKATKEGSNETIYNSAGSSGYYDSINSKWKSYSAWVGVISVNSKIYNRGCYLEGSFKQPNSSIGYWTAFWLNGRDSWPPELDIFEYLSSHGTSTWYTAIHGGSGTAGWYYPTGNNLRTTFNTVALDWGYGYIKMYCNGSTYFTLGSSDSASQKNMYLILNTGIGAWESEPTSATTWNTGLEIEYFRSYQYY